MISAETGCDIIICDHEGVIIEATQKERIGNNHVGAKIIMSGLTDEAVISPIQEESFARLGTDTRVGYNYVIIIQGQRVGSLGMAGDPQVLKPIVRIAAKTIGIYISEYLKEKEKNMIIQKMARIADEMTEQSICDLDYHIFTEDLLLISGAKVVLFNEYSPNKDYSTTVAISGEYNDIAKAGQEILGCSILGKQWNVNSNVYNDLRKKRMVIFPRVSDLPKDIISYDEAENLKQTFGLGQICLTEIAHKENILGTLIIIMGEQNELRNEVLIELYAAQIGQLLKRVQVEAALKKSESKHRVLVEKINDVIFNLDKQGNITYISPAIRELLGYEPEEMIGTNFAGYIYPQDLDDVQKVFDSSVMGNDESVVFRILNKFGKVYHVRSSTRLIQEEEEIVLGVMTNVTEVQQTLNILDSFWQHSPNPVSILDKDGKIVRISKSGTDIFGSSPEVLEGLNISEVFPLTVVEEVMGRLKMASDKKEPQSFSDSINLYNSDQRHYDSWFFPIANEEEETDLVGIVALDITDRKNTEERLNYLSFHDPVTGLYNRTYYERELERLDFSDDDYPVSVISLDADGLKIINDTLGHNMGDELLKNLADILTQSLRDSDILARVGGDEFIIFLPRTDSEAAQKIVGRIRENIKQYNEENLILPLSISLGLETADKPGENLEEVLKKADENMYNNKFFQKKNSQSQIISSFMASLEKRDYVSQGYAERLFKLFARVSQTSKLPSGTLKALALLAQVHDLGNVTIPDSILTKPVPLNEEEWNVVRLHPEKGSRIASISPNLVDITELIMKHHERWDGKGYPLGLKKEEIPIECRILAVVDSFDAMITERPYRKALSKLEAVKELKRCAGTQFDPKIVEFFIDILIEEGLNTDANQIELFA
ncbi:MAG: hypothetical protein APF84_08435 [Gracilibacter sp. BRH_c7a]|nr:MAG: hypothetical protein APF84_08435 [Gracilibacter sp. BRH_c7a]